MVKDSWVRAQEAYGHYYAGDLAQAIDVAQDAPGDYPHARPEHRPCVAPTRRRFPR